MTELVFHLEDQLHLRMVVTGACGERDGAPHRTPPVCIWVSLGPITPLPLPFVGPVALLVECGPCPWWLAALVLKEAEEERRRVDHGTHRS